MIEIFILSLIQGITEFLPVSSSSHLIIVAEIFKFEAKRLTIDVSVHIGSFLAVIFYFRKKIYNFISNKDLFLKIFFSSLPVIIIGYTLVKFDLINYLRNIKIIGWMTIIFGILLYVSDQFKIKKNIKNNFTYKSAIIIGIFQIFSLIPGVSRSGIVISASRILNFKRVDSAKISFLLSIPTLAAVSIFGLYNLIYFEDINFSLTNLFSIFLSFFFSLITIKYFIKYIKNYSLNIFVIYRIVLGLILLLFSYL